MELIIQPTFSTCGQACIAMIAGKSIDCPHKCGIYTLGAVIR